MSDAAIMQAIRAHLGLRQADLGIWLALGRTQIANVETGREPLPRHARPWLRAAEAVLALPEAEDSAAPEPFAPLPAVPATGPAAVLARLHECDYQARRLHQQLRALRQTQRLAARRLAAGPLLRAALPPPPAAPEAAPEPPALLLRRRWLVRLLEAAADALLPEAATGPVATTLLAARLGAWQHEAALLRAGLPEEP
ncbi:hypothetical protein SAMN02745146_2839 [Hymenobacter daecheongensis DSM 21074]|uniref:Uncharacterized protein n=1 Tax=Hymenobacter daecheongensis DSM 21074 TaxID=1121955 RepID=A0A1M6I8R5_9BACT|nr:hypothetical protein [Hymenobacter daecheongensis]SHJ30766.1 hypothetical protein SAMN02745146_2839 [Hymenobacter daecheongensis DSM 21074]